MRRTATLVAAVAMAAPMLVATPAAADEATATTPTQAHSGPTEVSARPMTVTYGAPAPDDSTATAPPDELEQTDGQRQGHAAARSASSAPSASALSSAPTAEFDLLFHANITESQRAVFRAAARIWGEVLAIRVPVQIYVEADSLPPGALGGAAPWSYWVDDPKFPRADVAYPVALANQHVGEDIDPGTFDIGVVISSDVDFYEGLDTAVPVDQYSLLQLALHELGHGLGHTTGAYIPDGQTRVRVKEAGYSLPYDRFVANSAGKRITDMSDSELQVAVVNPLKWIGPEAARRTSSSKALYAPDPFEPGSSIGHSNDPNQLMFPFIFQGEATSTIPSLAVGMLSDIGWPLPVSGRQAFGAAVTRDFLDRYATPTEMRSVESRLIAGTSRDAIVKSYAFSDEWVGALIDGYYLSTLGRLPDPSGRAYWISVIKGGATPAEVAAYFYASPEYFTRSGRTNKMWVTDLYIQILRRQPDAAGRDYWAGLADRGLAREVIAYDFYQSIESRRDRVKRLYRDLLGRNPDSAGHAYWAEILANGRDVDLAIFLASSQEYYSRALRRFP